MYRRIGFFWIGVLVYFVSDHRHVGEGAVDQEQDREGARGNYPYGRDEGRLASTSIPWCRRKMNVWSLPGWHSSGKRQEDLEEELTKTLDSWQRVNSKALINKVIFSSYHSQEWLELFTKYSISLPSSVDVERMLSYTVDILRAKQFILTSRNFEDLVSKRGNVEQLWFKDEDRL